MRRLEKVKIVDILRLSEMGISHRKIANSAGCGKTTISRLLKRCQDKAITHEQAQQMPEVELEALIYPGDQESTSGPPEPDWKAVQEEIAKHPNLNLQFLWEEYRTQNPDGKSYSWYCEKYRGYRKAAGRAVSLYHERKAGELMEVDWMGDTLPCIVDAATGEITEAHFFVSVLGYSHYPFVQAFPNEKEENWIQAHVNALAYYGGVPRIIEPDNCKTAVKTPRYYEPTIHTPYWELAQHYEVAVNPARVRKPKDKPAVEQGVGWLETWLLGKLRNQRFFGYPELNKAVLTHLKELSHRSFQKREGSRHSEFVRIDKPALRQLPATKFELADIKKKKVGDNYHLEYDGFYYSVPYTLHNKHVILRATAATIEVIKDQDRVASHQRRYRTSEGRYVTNLAHMPENHRVVHQSRQFDGPRYRTWAASIGSNTHFIVDTILKSGKVEEQGYRSCMGLLQLMRSATANWWYLLLILSNKVLSKPYGNEQLEASCERARSLGAATYTTVKNILKNGVLRLDAPGPKATPQHENIRGSEYYQ